jgi:ABC-type Fe3+ transport system permease subunit
MTVLLPALAVAFATFCVWLTVRIVNRRERWAQWTLAAIIFVTAYPMSLGPVCWMDQKGWLSDGAKMVLAAAYAPLTFVSSIGGTSLEQADGPFGKVLWRYVGIWRRLA